MHFREADQLCKELDVYSVTLKYLGVQVLAYQSTGQLPKAFELAQKIQKLADKEEDQGGLADALATQGQILIDSRDEIGSLEKFKTALGIAEEIEDKARQMKILGAMGNYSLTIASTDKAESYYRDARDLAREIGDKQSEIGFHGNIGIVLEWKGKFAEAGKKFSKVLAFFEETNNREAQLQPLYHLTQIAVKQNDDAKVIEYAEAGIDCARDVDNSSFSLPFYEKLIPVYFRLGLTEDAEVLSAEAIKAAKKARNLEIEVSFLLSLAEFYMLEERYESALELYQEAQKGTRKLKHHDNEAYTIGRIGVCLAELDRPDEALHHHKIASKVAKEMGIASLEAEQLVMQAIIYRDMQENDKALEMANQSLGIYEKAEMAAEIEMVQQLISELA